MSAFGTQLEDALLALLEARGINAERVVSWRQETEESGYCETCYFSQVVVYIRYQTYGDIVESTTQTYTYYGDFGELIRELTND